MTDLVLTDCDGTELNIHLSPYDFPGMIQLKTEDGRIGISFKSNDDADLVVNLIKNLLSDGE